MSVGKVVGAVPMPAQMEATHEKVLGQTELGSRGWRV